MKIAKALRDAYAASKEKYDRLGEEIKSLLKERVEDQGWFLTFRVKSLESFALKVETGRVPDVHQMEDFLGFTVVVPNATALPAAEALILEMFTLRQRRPAAGTSTKKSSSNFLFDDVRLYLSRGPSVSGKNPDLDTVPFEIQLRTILQHAWSVATHDLVYKTDTVSWSKERIAFQVKAMLEHAEVAIAEAGSLANSPSVAKQDQQTADLSSIIGQVVAFWPQDQLPTDVKRLSESILELLKAADLQAAGLTALLEAEKARIGTLPSNLSPYSFALQALANSTTTDFQSLFNRRFVRTRLVVNADMEVPAWLLKTHNRIIQLPTA